jgi:putative ABC transport system permease protein
VWFLGFIGHNLRSKWLRTLLTGFAVAIGVLTVVTLAVVTQSLRDSAADVLQTGKADFTVAQKGVDGALNSVIDDAQVARIATTPGVASAIGALIVLEDIEGASNFVEVGIAPDALPGFGVHVVAGRPFTADAKDEVMLGWRAAENLGKQVGDTITMASGPKKIVGIFRTGQAFGDSGAMLPLKFFQGEEQRSGAVTLAFVKVAPGAKIPAVRKALERNNPSLTTVRTATDFGRVDRTLEYLDVAITVATVLALVIGTVIVMNTMLLSFVERTREFGVLRAIGWSTRRLWGLILGEALCISFVGAALGVGLSFALVRALERLPDVRGILHATYTASDVWRALYTAGIIGVVAAVYPAVRASRLQPLDAMRHE